MIKFAHTNIITDDWKRLSDFYIKVFGCRPLLPERDLSGEWLERSTAVEKAHIRGVHLVLPGFEENSPTLEIFQYDENLENSLSVANRKGFGHIAFLVDDVQAMLKKVLENGGSAVGDLVENEVKNAGILTFVYVRDIDGNIIELQSWREK